jgi:hypothetical protein
VNCYIDNSVRVRSYIRNINSAHRVAHMAVTEMKTQVEARKCMYYFF